MGNNKLGENENILVKVDVNNLIFIDPNSVQNGDEVQDRGIKQENLVMYVNLEADLVPRTTLTAVSCCSSDFATCSKVSNDGVCSYFL